MIDSIAIIQFCVSAFIKFGNEWLANIIKDYKRMVKHSDAVGEGG